RRRASAREDGEDVEMEDANDAAGDADEAEAEAEARQGEEKEQQRRRDRRRKRLALLVNKWTHAGVACRWLLQHLLTSEQSQALVAAAAAAAAGAPPGQGGVCLDRGRVGGNRNENGRSRPSTASVLAMPTAVIGSDCWTLRPGSRT
ncbi:unnamed protein product, partial [Ectocarpus sp. 12 AP-2014]